MSRLGAEAHCIGFIPSENGAVLGFAELKIYDFFISVVCKMKGICTNYYYYK